MKPSVSVIVPVHNGERHIVESLRSVLRQTIAEDIEVIVVDDGSEDSTLAVVERSFGNHPNVRLNSIPASGSAAVPRNVGLDQASGEFVFFLDADDVLAPHALQALVEKARHDKVDIVLGKMKNFGPGSPRSLPRRVFEVSRIAEDFIDCFAYRTLGPTKLFRKALIDDLHLRFPTGYTIGEDQPFVMAAYLASPRVSALADDVYYWVRNHEANISLRAQDPKKNLLKNSTLIETVASGMPAGDRRDTLLLRPLSRGLTNTFRSPAFEKLDSYAQNELLGLVQAYRQLWTPELRSRSSFREQITLDAVFFGDRNVLNAVLKPDVSESRPRIIDLKVSSDGLRLKYRGGYTTGPLPRATFKAELVTVSFLSDGAAMVFDLKSDLPIPVRHGDWSVVWKHRATGRVVRTRASNSKVVDGERSVTTVVTSRALRIAGVWDAFMDFRLRDDVGQVRVRVAMAARGSFPAAVGRYAEDVFFITEYGNLSFERQSRLDGHDVGHPCVIVGRRALNGRTTLTVHGALPDRRMNAVMPDQRVLPTSVRAVARNAWEVSFDSRDLPAKFVDHGDGSLMPIEQGGLGTDQRRRFRRTWSSLRVV